eukprot:4581532-Amphidinium_carterae.1
MSCDNRAIILHTASGYRMHTGRLLPSHTPRLLRLANEVTLLSVAPDCLTWIHQPQSSRKLQGNNMFNCVTTVPSSQGRSKERLLMTLRLHMPHQRVTDREQDDECIHQSGNGFCPPVYGFKSNKRIYDDPTGAQKASEAQQVLELEQELAIGKETVEEALQAVTDLHVRLPVPSCRQDFRHLIT